MPSLRFNLAEDAPPKKAGQKNTPARARKQQSLIKFLRSRFGEDEGNEDVENLNPSDAHNKVLATNGERTQEDKNKGEEKIFDVDKALHDDAFLSFLARVPDREVILSKDEAELGREMERLYQTYQDAQKVTENLKEVYSSALKEQFRVDAKEIDMTVVDDYTRLLATEEPERLEMLATMVREYKELPGRIAEKERVLTELGDLGALRKKERALQYLHENEGEGADWWHSSPLTSWFFKRLEKPEEKDLRRHAKEMVGDDYGQIDKKLREIRAALKASRDIAQARAAMEVSMTKLRQVLFTEVEPAAALVGIVSARAQEIVEDCWDSFDTEQGMETLERAWETQKFFLPDPSRTRYFDVEAPMRAMEHTTRLMERKFGHDFITGLGEFVKLTPSYKELEKIAKPFLERETLGLHSRDEIKKAKIKAVRLALDTLGKDPKYSAHRILLKRLEQKVQQQP